MDEVALSREICAALKRIVNAKNLSSARLAEMTGISESNIRRMLSGNQEPKLSTIAYIEGVIDVPLGTVARDAGLMPGINTADMLLTDPDIHPVMRSIAVETYESWVRISKEFTS